MKIIIVQTLLVYTVLLSIMCFSFWKSQCVKIYTDKIVVSVIVPIYNTGRYLDQTVDSILRQTLGAAEQIQIILVNDGSTDTSQWIMKRYQSQYPKNIISINQAHQGVSSARNAGIPFATGKYTTFLDSDDRWDKAAFQLMYDFFERHYDEIDIVTARMKFFEAKNSYHILDYKFTSTRVVDLNRDFTCIQLSAATCFFKTAQIAACRFSELLDHQEDAQFVNSILLKKPYIGIVREAIYFCRKRADGSSAVQRSLSSPGYFLNSALYFAMDLVKASIKQYGRVLTFIQYLIMYDLQWKIPQTIPTILSPTEYQEYKSILTLLLTYIDDTIIISQKHLWLEYKMVCLSQKHHQDIRHALTCSNETVFYQHLPLFRITNRYLIQWIACSIRDETLLLVGQDLCLLHPDTYRYTIETDGIAISGSFQDNATFYRSSIFGELTEGRSISFALPLPKRRQVLKIAIHCFNGTFIIKSSLASSMVSMFQRKTSWCNSGYRVSFLPDCIAITQELC